MAGSIVLIQYQVQWEHGSVLKMATSNAQLRVDVHQYPKWQQAAEVNVYYLRNQQIFGFDK